MGEKDFQQLYLVKTYIEKKYKSKIVPCKTIRDNKGLALSSRNLLLNQKKLIKQKFNQNISEFKKKLKNQKNIKN